MQEWIADFQADFHLNFIEQDRWKFLVDGLEVTLQLTFFSAIIGIFIGILVAMIRSTHDKTIGELPEGFQKFMLKLVNAICKTYLTLIRGTPVVMQLLIMSNIIMSSSNNKLLIGILTFGVNSGAYVAEIVRGGILSVDNGQFEAGRSLGFNYSQTMKFIVLPQAFKNVLPNLANEFIVLLKETSVVGYIALQDLTRAGDIISGRTFSPMMPLLGVAFIYLILVSFFTWLVGKLEVRLRNNER